MTHRPRYITALMILSDIVFINIAFVIAYWIRYDLQWFRAVDPAYDVPFDLYIPFEVLLTAVLIMTFATEGIYRGKRIDSWFEEVYGIFNGVTTGTIIMMALVFFLMRLFYSRLIFFYAGGLVVLLLGLSRLILRIIESGMRRHGIGVNHILIVGVGEIGRTVIRNIVAHPELGFEIIGFVDDDPQKGQKDIGKFRALGSTDNLEQILSQERIDEVIITLPWQYHRKIISIMEQSKRRKVRARIVPDIFQMTLNHMDIIQVAGIPLIGVKEVSISPASRFIKRAMDISLASLALFFSSPLLAATAIGIKLDSPGPVLFTQTRVGKWGKPFTLYKFRSMVQKAEELKSGLKNLNEANGPLFKIKDDPRRTRLGKILRRISLDEFPQFYNVLVGEMSIVGPRPPIPEEVQEYEEWQKRRLDVAPGLTGLWQVSGRSDLSFDEMALLDIYYIENWSPFIDIKIILQTIPRVIFGNGAY